jgi:hypothetical protein
MSNRKLSLEEIDEVERLRRVRRELEREHGGRAGYFAWIAKLDQQRRSRAKKAGDRRAIQKKSSKRPAATRKKQG